METQQYWRVRLPSGNAHQHPATLIRCIRVCRLWYRVLSPLLWQVYDTHIMNKVSREVVLAHGSHFPFIRMCTKNKGDLPLAIAVISSTRLLNELTWNMLFSKRAIPLFRKFSRYLDRYHGSKFYISKIGYNTAPTFCKDPQRKP